VTGADASPTGDGPSIENDTGTLFDLRIAEGGHFRTPGGSYGHVFISLDRMEPGVMCVEVTLDAVKAVKLEVDLIEHGEAVVANLGEPDVGTAA
jgi:hypothetical protein